jgi:hypothetical protein
VKLRHRKPCRECPWRKIAKEGWLGGQSAEMYADAVSGNEVPACHLRDFGPESPRSAMCAGALAVMSNSATSAWKTEGGDAARKQVGQRQDCFSRAAEFYKHHTGETYVPYVIRMLT